MIKKETISKAEQLANSLIDSKLKEKNEVTKIEDPILHLRNTTANFINQRFEKIQKDAGLETIIIEALKTKIEEGTPSFSELTNFLNQLRLRSTESSDSLLNFFKPQTGESSPLLSDTTREGLDAESQVFKNAKPEDLKVYHKLIQILQSKEFKEN